MTQTFRLSIFQHKKDNKPQVIGRTWQELCERFQNPAIREDKDGLLMSPAFFEPARRLKENVKEVSLLCFDVDHDANIETVKARFDSLGCAYAIHSTHSHLRQTESNPNAEPRYRVVIPLSRPIAGNEFPSLWQFVKTQTALPFDEQAKDASRCYYTPTIAETNAPYAVCIRDGAFFDWQKLPLDSYVSNGNHSKETDATNGQNGNGRKSVLTDFEFHEDRHAELSRRIEARARNTGRGTFEMKCPAHNGKGDSSLFYEPTTKSVACLKKPNPCSYFEILAAFGLPAVHLPSRERSEKIAAELEEREIKPKAFPVPSEKCFYGLAGEYVRIIEPHTEADSMALLIQFLTYFGNIIGRSAFYQVEADKHYTNLFCVLVGDTASGRKGTSFGRVKEIFKDADQTHERDCIVSGLASGEGLLYHIRDAVFEEKTDKRTKAVETVCTDAGVSDKRLLVIEGEFAQVLRVQGREGNTLSSFLRNLWDSGTARNLTKNSPLRTTDAQVSIIGHITSTELLTCLNEVESANGYANRFLWIAVRRSKFLPFGAGENNFHEIEAFKRKLIQKIDFARNVGRMIFTAEARNLYAVIYEKLETSRFGFLAKITHRASAYVCRLSCIFALLDGKDEIDREHLEAALAVWQYAEDSARYIFGERIGDKNADTLLNALRESANGLTLTEIANEVFQKNLSAAKIQNAVQMLLAANLIYVKKETSEGAKRPSQRIFANSRDNEFNGINGFYQPFENAEPIKSVNSVSSVSDIQKTETEKPVCKDCQKELDTTAEGQLFCPVCLTCYEKKDVS